MNNSPQYPLQISHQLRTSCKLASLNMGGPSLDPIRCGKQNNEEKTQVEGHVKRETMKEKEPFKSKCDSGTCWAYFMAYGVIESISTSAFVEGALALDLPLSKCYVFPNPFICLFICPLIIFAGPLYKVSSYSIIAWDWSERGKGRAQVRLDFESPLLSFLSFFSITLLFF
jgi:hypothetical protein